MSIRVRALFAVCAIATFSPTAFAQTEEDPDEPPEETAPVAPAPETPPEKKPPPETPPPVSPSETPPPKVDPPAPPTAGAPVSWTMLAGAVPESGALIHGEVGFSGLFRGAYHHSLGGGLSIGGLAAFDYASFAPDAAFSSRLILAVPIRYAMMLGENIQLGLRGDPGAIIVFEGTSGIQLDLQANVGWVLDQRFIAGAGLDMPIGIFIGSNGALAWPLLAGGFIEYHVAPPVALTLDAKIGPYFVTSGGVLLGLRVHAGVAYRL